MPKVGSGGGLLLIIVSYVFFFEYAEKLRIFVLSRRNRVCYNARITRSSWLGLIRISIKAILHSINN